MVEVALEWASKSPFCFLFLFPRASKLRPALSREENRNLLAVCCQSTLSYPSKAQMNKGRKTVRAAVNLKVPTGQCLPTSGSGSHLSAPWQPP